MTNWNIIKQTSRDLRKKQTPEEKVLWTLLRNRKLNGKKFLRQHPIVFRDSGVPEFYIVDFFCHEKNLIIELDGKIHELQKEDDSDREFILKEMGFQILRIKNEELIDIDSVIKMIKKYLE